MRQLCLKAASSRRRLNVWTAVVVRRYGSLPSNLAAPILALTLITACGIVRPAALERVSALSTKLTIAPSGVALPAMVQVGAHVDTLQSVTVPDPYRGLEDTLSVQGRAWMARQESYAAAIIARVVKPDSLAAIYERAYRDAPTLGRVRDTPDGLVLMRWLGDEPSLFAVAPGASRERLLRGGDDSASRAAVALRAFVPSHDGRLIALGTTSGGDAAAAISVIRAVDGAALADSIPDLLTSTSGTRYEVSWLPRIGAAPDAFFYPRLWPKSAVAPAAERLARGRQFLHRIGRPQSSDVAIFGFDVSSAVPMEKDDLPTRVLAAPGSRWLVGTVFRSRQNGNEYYVARRTPGDSTVPAWALLASLDERVASPQLRGDTVYALSRRNADRGQIVRRVLGNGLVAAGNWMTVVPERPGVLTTYALQPDGLYFIERNAGAMVLHALSHGDARVREVNLPLTGTVRFAPPSPALDGVLVSVESWASPPRWFRVRRGGAVVDPVAFDDGRQRAVSPTLVSTRLEAPSRDGTLVPVSIVFDSGAVSAQMLNGSAPLLIEAYGGFGEITEPRYDPNVQVWTSLGGVYAYAHVRGGGELGDAWHRAATREHKQRSIDDMIGAVEALIARRYTSAGRVAIQGISFGAIISGLAALQRPELFGAAVYDVGGPDEIRAASLDPSAARNIAEIGDTDSPEGVRSLRAASPYHAVPPRVALPAMLIHSATDDYNFGTEMLVAKYVARLQAANSGDRPVVWVRTAGGHRWLSSLSPMWAAQVASFLLWQTADARFQPVVLPQVP